jgi:hypothetical protein
VMLRRKDYSELRSSPFGPLPLATFSRWCSSRTFEVDDGRFAVSSLMIAREPHHGVTTFYWPLPSREARRIIPNDASL